MVKPLQVVVKMAQLGFGNCEAVATEGTVKTNLTLPYSQLPMRIKGAHWAG
jgi:hypothetical protein